MGQAPGGRWGLAPQSLLRLTILVVQLGIAFLNPRFWELGVRGFRNRFYGNYGIQMIPLLF